MKRTAFIMTISSAALALTTIASLAQARGVDFSTLDLDGNGAVTLEEMRASGQVRFDEVDTDGDGFLSQTELAAHSRAQSEERAARMISRMDKNEDGKLSLDEMKPRRGPERIFNRMDRNDDGSISAEEFEQAQAHMRDRRHDRKHDR